MTKRTINIKDVFTLGSFGPVQLGQTIEEVEQILGKATFKYNSIYGEDFEYNVKFLRYDSYEFWFIKYFDDSGEYKLSGFQVRDYHFENGYEGQFKKGIVLDLWIFKLGLTIKDTEKALEAEGMRYTKSDEYDFNVLNLENNSKIYFIKPHYSDSIICQGWTYHPKHY